MLFVSRINRAFDKNLPVRCLFDAPTVEELADQVGSGIGLKTPLLVPVNPKPDELPLSFLQERYWCIDEISRVQGHTSSLFEVLGPFDLSVFEASFNRLIARQETLRISFHTLDDRPFQAISPEVTASLSVIDFSQVADSVYNPQVRKLLLAEADLPIELSRPPLFRITVLRMGAERHVLMFTAHHILFDGWSWMVFYKELEEIYGAVLHAGKATLQPLPIQYSDFVLWQRNWFQGAVLETELSFWRRKFRGTPRLLAQLTDRADAVRKGAWHRVPFRFSDDLVKRLREVSRQQGVTVLMTTLAIYKVLLSHLSALTDISLTTFATGRNRQETESLLGYFAGVVGLRTTFDRSSSFLEMLEQVRLGTLEAFARQQDLPFQKLVSELYPEHDLRHVSEVTFTYYPADDPRLELSLPGLEVHAIKLEHEEHGSLHLQIDEGAHEISGGFYCAGGLFQAGMGERMKWGYEHLAGEVVLRPEASLADLLQTAVEEDERHWHAQAEKLKTTRLKKLQKKRRKGVKL